MGKLDAINNQLENSAFPISLSTLEDLKMKLPKIERSYIEITLKALRKEFKSDQLFYALEGVQPSLTKYGFLLMTETDVVLSIHKGSIMPSATIEKIPFAKIKEVDFDIIPIPINPFGVNEGIIYLTHKKGFGSKKLTIRDVTVSRLDSLVEQLKYAANQHN